MPPIEVLIFCMLPESVLMAYVGTGLLKIKSRPGQLMIIALLYMFSAYIVRSKYVMGFLGVGMHSIVLVLTLGFIIKTVLKIRFRTSAVAALLPFVLVFLGDCAILSPLLKYIGVNVAQITQSIWRWIVFSWISDGFLVLVAILIAVKGFHLITVLDVDLETKNIEGKQ